MWTSLKTWLLRWNRPPPPSSAEVKGTVELYLYSPSGPSWPVQGWTSDAETDVFRATSVTPPQSFHPAPFLIPSSLPSSESFPFIPPFLCLKVCRIIDTTLHHFPPEAILPYVHCFTSLASHPISYVIIFILPLSPPCRILTWSSTLHTSYNNRPLSTPSDVLICQVVFLFLYFPFFNSLCLPIFLSIIRCAVLTHCAPPHRAALCWQIKKTWVLNDLHIIKEYDLVFSVPYSFIKWRPWICVRRFYLKIPTNFALFQYTL